MKKILFMLAAFVLASIALVPPASASGGEEEKPSICHPVGSATGGNLHNGYSLISPDKASSHIDESLYPDGHYWKHEHDGRHDVYYINGQCDDGSQPSPPPPTCDTDPSLCPPPPTPTCDTDPSLCPQPPNVKHHTKLHLTVIDKCRCKKDVVKITGRHLQFKSVKQRKNHWTIRVVADKTWLVPKDLSQPKKGWARSATYHLTTSNKPCPCEKKHTCTKHKHHHHKHHHHKHHQQPCGCKRH